MVELSDDVRAVIESPRLAHLATVNPDGSPQMSAIWVGLDESNPNEIVAAHLMAGRKIRNIEADPRVVLTIEAGGKNPVGMQHYLIVRGRARLEAGGAPELLQRLARVYVSPEAKFPPMDSPPPGHLIRITPESIGGVGPWSE